MTTHTTQEQQAQQDRLATLRTEVMAEQLAHANAHNARKQGLVTCSCCGEILHNITDTNERTAA